MKTMKHSQIKNQNGFTLVEVVASIVIISIILFGVVNLINFTNQVAVSNNNRIVALNLGKATIERIKVKPDLYFDNSSSNINRLPEEGLQYTKDTCDTTNCEENYSIYINDKTYFITLTVKQDKEEKKLELIDVLIKVELPGENISHQVEGYVQMGGTT